MAHFAELDENNVVLRVILVDNKDTCDDEGIEKEEIGIKYLENLLGGKWIQTSYNNNFRGSYAGANWIYDKNLDVFLAPQPYPSWVLDGEYHWVPPVESPNTGKWDWDENNQKWVEITE